MSSTTDGPDGSNSLSWKVRECTVPPWCRPLVFPTPSRRRRRRHRRRLTRVPRDTNHAFTPTHMTHSPFSFFIFPPRLLSQYARTLLSHTHFDSGVVDSCQERMMVSSTPTCHFQGTWQSLPILARRCECIPCYDPKSLKVKKKRNTLSIRSLTTTITAADHHIYSWSNCTQEHLFIVHDASQCKDEHDPPENAIIVFLSPVEVEVSHICCPSLHDLPHIFAYFAATSESP
jgi:hypothetical protein